MWYDFRAQPDIPFDTDKMSHEFCMQFQNQAMQPGQTIFFKFNECKLLLTVTELSGESKNLQLLLQIKQKRQVNDEQS